MFCFYLICLLKNYFVNMYYHRFEIWSHSLLTLDLWQFWMRSQDRFRTVAVLMLIWFWFWFWSSQSKLGMVMEEISPQLVALEFVKQYYTLLNKAPLHLHRYVLFLDHECLCEIQRWLKCGIFSKTRACVIKQSFVWLCCNSDKRTMTK